MWTVGTLPISILTDFEKFAVYDCRIKPVHTDSASVGRLVYLGFEDYIRRWSDLEQTFSREAVIKGSFDKFTEASKIWRIGINPCSICSTA